MASLASGTWVTRERVGIAAAAVAFFTVVVLAGLVVTSHGGVDLIGRPLGTDFSSFYAAGRAVLDGRAADAYDPALHFARQQALFGAATPFYGWLYPPFFFLVVGPLALLPYLPALILWQGATLALYLVALRAILKTDATGPVRDRLWWLVALGFPAVFVNLGHGQNAFLSAALLGGGLALIDRRPLLAGLCFGLLAYKPQLGMMIPLVLIATGRWRVFAAATATVIALALVVTMIFGWPLWEAFLASTRLTRRVLLENGDPGWEKLQTAFAWVRLWGGSIALAYAVQALTTLVLAAGLIWLWRRAVPLPLPAAALAIAAVAGTPFSLDYDMTLLAVAIAFLAVDARAHGAAPWQMTTMAALWLAPLLARTFATFAIPLGAMTMLAALAFVFVHARATLPGAGRAAAIPPP